MRQSSPVFIALLASISRQRTSACVSAFSTMTTSGSGLWTPIAIDAAKKFTISQREKLDQLGALEKQFGPIQIVGEPIDTSRDNSNDDDATICTKVIHFQRHGQGYHNLICDMWREAGRPIDFDSLDPELNPLTRNEFIDPPLTNLGRQQCTSVREGCSQLSPEVVIVSPLLRCIQTAKLSFRDHADTTVTPWVSHEGCREELGLLTGNKRRPIAEIRDDFPEIDFAAINHDEDELWNSYKDRRETLLEKSERIYDFLTSFVMQREESEIAVVSHSAYLFTLLNAVMDIEDEDLRSWFLTGEVRSLRVTYKRRENN
jgi:broad specificity phosphatase PhoE